MSQYHNMQYTLFDMSIVLHRRFYPQKERFGKKALDSFDSDAIQKGCKIKSLNNVRQTLVALWTLKTKS